MLAQAGVLLCRRDDGRRTARSRSARSSPSTSTSACSCMPLRSLGMWIGQAQRATASGERIFQVMDEPEEVADRPDADRAPARPGRRALRGRIVRVPRRAARCSSDVDLDVAAGRTVALIGHTGSGKTTLTSLVPRFYDVDRGPGARRRPRRARRDARVAPPRDRRDLAGSVPLLGDRPREHRLRRPATCRRRRSRRSRAPRRRTSSSSGCRRATTR